YSMAAARGSENGCANLGACFAAGSLGLQKNLREAERWFRAMGSASVRDADDSQRGEVANWLRERAPGRDPVLV
ncbi:MAG: hypothetical protein VW937_04440, partial [Actinomycetota bacterium]